MPIKHQVAKGEDIAVRFKKKHAEKGLNSQGIW